MSEPSRPDDDDPSGMTRREFTALSLAAGVAVAIGPAAAQAEASTTEKDVEVKTPDGVCDAVLVRPDGEGRWPGVILFPDAFGLRPTMRAMARRLAADGYVVLAINPFYRATRAPGTGPDFDFQDPAARAKLDGFRAALTNDAVARDARAFVAYLDAQPFVNKAAPAGAFGYCMGGLMTLQAAAGVPERIGAGASFHGGGLVTDKPGSPHLLVPKMKGRYLIAIAASDDMQQPDAKTKLREAFAAAHLPATIEVYEGTLHGWCVPDMPKRDGKPIYDEAQAERAWKALTALFGAALAQAAHRWPGASA
jgi:carboxymethylenebutenolidase